MASTNRNSKRRSTKRMLGATTLALTPLLVAGAALANANGNSASAQPAQLAPQQVDDDDDTTTTTAADEVLTEGGQGGGDNDETVVSSSGGGSGTRTAGGRITNLNPDLRLDRAEIDSLDLDDGEEEYIMFQFGGFVRSIEDARGFTVSGPGTGSSVSSQDARLVQGEANQVLVAFASGTDLNQYSIATVETGAVEDEVGQGNLPATVALDGDGVSITGSAGPDLVSVSFNETLDRATYEFDENLDENSSPSAADFGFTTFDGREAEGSDVISVEDELVIVEFDDQVEKAVRFFARGAAIDDQQGIASVPGSVGGDTTSPDLVSVNRVDGDTQFDFEFSEGVTNAESSNFHVFDDAGTLYEGDQSARVDENTVRVFFADIDDFTDDIVVAAVDSDAVEANDGSAVSNTVGSVEISGAGLELGNTAGPDLTGITIDEDAGQVLFEFDENVDDDQDYDPADFWVITTAGDLVPGRTFIEAEDAAVLVTFDKNVVEAEDGFVVAAGAVQDEAGNDSAPASTSGNSNNR